MAKKIKVLLISIGILVTSISSIFGYKLFTENFEIRPKEKVLGEQEVEPISTLEPTLTPTPTPKPTFRSIPTDTPVPTNTQAPNPSPTAFPTSSEQPGPTACQLQVAELMGRIYGNFLRIRELGEYFGPYEEQMRTEWMADIERTRNEVWARMASCPGSQEYYDAAAKKIHEAGFSFP